MLATPWPQVSRVLFEPESVMSSTSFAVMSDSMMPTSATARANGAMIVRVFQFRGTSGSSRFGRLDGRRPSSPTVGTWMPDMTTTAVSSTIAIRGAGTALVNRGRSTMIAMPTAAIG